MYLDEALPWDIISIMPPLERVYGIRQTRAPRFSVSSFAMHFCETSSHRRSR
jgi:hypothetical protein